MTSTQVINLEYLKVMAEGDADLEKTMLEMILEELPAEFSSMQELYAKQDWHQLFQVSHKMKSTLAFVGNKEMTEANKALEQCTRNQENLEEVGGYIETLSKHFNPVMAALREAMEAY